MPLYEIINPSDAYTIKHDDPEAVALAGLFLGEGHYGLEDEQGQTFLPIFLLSSEATIEKWFKERFGKGFLDIAREKPVAIAEAFESVLIGSMESRREFEEAKALMTLEKAAEYEASRHDRMRTSVNIIGRHAKQLAKKFRAKATASV